VPSSAKSIQDLQAGFRVQQEKLKEIVAKGRKVDKHDPLKDVRIESELRREIRENIAHQRMIGSYVGKRHAMHLPVRGQNTQSNAKTARKLNQLDRYG